MSMKLSYRDKVIVIVLSVIVIIAVGIFCFIKPKAEELQASEDRLVAKQAEEAQVKEKMGTLEDLKKKLEDDVKSIEEAQKKFLSEKETGETYQISQYIMAKIQEVGVDIMAVNLDRLESVPLDPYTYEKYSVAYPLKINGDLMGELPQEVLDKYNKVYPVIPPFTDVAGTVLTIEYECDDPDDVYEAIDIIAENEENIYLLTCGADFSEREPDDAGVIPRIEASLTIMIYEINPIDTEALEESLKD